jgi:glycosyltransferase involved in cell wall biosynthesis
MSLRILHVTPYFEDAWGYGGIPRIVTTLTRELARRGHHVTVCTTDAGDAHQRAGAHGAATASGVDVLLFPNVSNALAYHAQLFLPRGLGAYLARHAGEFDVAHLHACRNVPVSMATRRLRRAGVPYVLAPNGTAPRLERRRLAKWAYDLTLGRGDLEGAAAVLAVTDAEARSLERLGVPAGRIRRIANPLDVEPLRTALVRGGFRARHQLGDAPLVVVLGKLTPRKRVDLVLRALATGLGPDVRVAVIGNDMGSLASLRTLARQLGVNDRVLFTGLLRGDERLHALADADVVAHPAVDEIFGLAPMEALLAGTPVVVAGDSGAGEIVSAIGGGLVVPPGEAGALADGMRRVLAAPAQWRAEAARAATAIRARFAGPVIAGELDALYGDIARH